MEAFPRVEKPLTRVTKLIFINGWPGVGKATIAEMLTLMLGDKANLIEPSNGHNETYQLPPDHPDFEQAQRKQRDAYFAEHVERPSTFKKIAIFADCQADTDEGRSVAREYEAAASRSRRLFLPIYLECQMEENMRRVQQMERQVSMKGKLGINEAKSVRARGGKLFVFREHQGLTINITNMAPQEAALQILSFMNDTITQRDNELANSDVTPMESKEPHWS